MDLTDVRKAIDKIDEQIKPLFIARMGCTKKIAAVKAQTGGAVFILDRENSIIEKNAEGVAPAIRDAYINFLRNLFSVSRHFQYGILKDMQNAVIEKALAKGGLKASTPHSSVEISFACLSRPGNLNILCNAVILSNVDIEKMSIENIAGIHHVDMVLAGNLRDAKLRQALTQIAKESTDFAIKKLKL
ncbi:MAG: chorismate mutase [Acidaminococcaceae bacterium]|jgi:chorismate mutase/chorismate mutase/prephenate dehydratase|nr:chorismate mutase [Acidaminococcaceae bacterium]